MKSNSSIIKFAKNSILFLVGSILSKILNFVLLPLYTNFIPTNDFGAYDINTMMLSFISSVIYFEIWSALLRFLYDYDDLEKPKVIKSSLKIFSISTIIFILISFTFFYLYNSDYIYYIIILGITTSFATYLGFLARGFNKNVDFAISGVINTLICLITNIVLIIVFKMNYSALYIGSILGMSIQIIYLLIRLKLIKKTIFADNDKLITKKLLKYALPLCFNTASYWLLHSATRLIYNYLCGDSASGIFSVGNKFGTIIVLATTCFTYAWQDLSFSETKNKPNTKLYTIGSEKYLLFLTSALVISLPLLKIIFPLLVKGDYIEAIDYVPLFLIVAMISGYSGFIGNIFYAIKDTKIISISTLISGIITVGLAFPLINSLGANGANISVLIGFIINVFIRFIILKRKISFYIPYKSIIISVIWITISSLVYLFLNNVYCIILFISNIIFALFIFKNDIIDIIKR